MKRSQAIMIWLLPIILIGGSFFPLLGYLVLGMMVFFIILSFFKGRFWCWNLCPRGSFLDIVLSKVTFNRPLPKVFAKMWFRWGVFMLLMAFLIYRLITKGENIVMIGAVFVTMCIVTTFISIILGVSMKHRAWCMICPMGTLQEKVHKLSLKKGLKK